LLQRSHQNLLAHVIGFHHFVSEALNRSAGLPLLLTVLNHHYGQPRNSTAVVVNFFARVGVIAAHLHKPRAVKLTARLKPIKGTVGFWFKLHGQFLVAMITSTYCTLIAAVALDNEPEKLWS
jgi:hypothetical protein